MTSCQRFLATVLSILVVSGCESSISDPLESSPLRPAFSAWPNERYGVVPLGLAEDEDTIGGKVLPRAASAGVTWVRSTVYWYALQPEQPTDTAGYSFVNTAGVHRLVDRATQRGMNVVMTIYGTPAWASLCSSSCSNSLPPDPSMLVWWREFVKDVIAEFPDVDYWSVWNEPNDNFFLSAANDSARYEAYSQILSYAADAIRDAGKYVVAPELGAVTGNLDFLDRVLEDHGDSIDVVSVHIYGYAEPAAAFMGSVRTLTTNAGYWDTPVWLTEWTLSVEDSVFSEYWHANHLMKIYDLMDNNWWVWEKTFLFDFGTFPGRMAYLNSIGNFSLTPAGECLWSLAVQLPEEERSNFCRWSWAP